jgi:putative peptidoglycan lipid II flippase
MFLLKLVVALLVMAAVLYFAMGDASSWLAFSLIKRLFYISGLVVLGGVSYFATLMLLGFRPRDYIRRVNR